MTDRTTDEWTEDFYDAFAEDVDVNIQMLTELRGDEAYQLRRMIMISLRHGRSSAHVMTERIDALKAELARCDVQHVKTCRRYQAEVAQLAEEKRAAVEALDVAEARSMKIEAEAKALREVEHGRLRRIADGCEENNHVLYRPDCPACRAALKAETAELKDD